MSASEIVLAFIIFIVKEILLRREVDKFIALISPFLFGLPIRRLI